MIRLPPPEAQHFLPEASANAQRTCAQRVQTPVSAKSDSGSIPLRIEKMIENGILEVVSPAEKGKMGYARVLKKIGNLS